MLKGKTVAALTLGCKVNQYETDAMVDMLTKAGATAVEFDQVADIYIVNTCSVTNMADKKSRQMLHRAKKLNPKSIVVAAGCYVQAAKDKLEKDAAIDIIISNNRKKDIKKILIDYINVKNEKGAGAGTASNRERPQIQDANQEYNQEMRQSAQNVLGDVVESGMTELELKENGSVSGVDKATVEIQNSDQTTNSGEAENADEVMNPDEKTNSDGTKNSDENTNSRKTATEISRKAATETSYVDISKESEYEEMGAHVPTLHTRAYVKIQDGCNQFCSYCIIPYVRGRIRSRAPQSVVEEVEELAASGIKEIVLTGIHISSYGKDKENVGTLIDLIDHISKIKGIKRIRLGSLEPGIITQEFVDRISSNSKVCPHFHLSLQSGCDTVLKRMNRKYTCEEYLEKCDMLRKAYGNPALTTDVIVGFPGETDEEFEQTVEYLEKLNLYEMHIFKFSPRSGTVAAKMPGQIHPDVKHKRSEILLEMSQKHKQNYEKQFEDKEIQVLVEEVVKQDGNAYLRGHTERYMDVHINVGQIDYPESFINSIVYARYSTGEDVYLI